MWRSIRNTSEKSVHSKECTFRSRFSVQVFRLKTFHVPDLSSLLQVPSISYALILSFYYINEGCKLWSFFSLRNFLQSKYFRHLVLTHFKTTLRPDKPLSLTLSKTERIFGICNPLRFSVSSNLNWHSACGFLSTLQANTGHKRPHLTRISEIYLKNERNPSQTFVVVRLHK
jgi:hypothetical protein